MTRVAFAEPILPPPTTRTRDLRGHIYFVRVHSFVKIGFSVNVRKRLETLQAGSPYRFELLFSIPGRESLEANLHRLYASQRHFGEWFRLEGDLAKFLADRGKL